MASSEWRVEVDGEDHIVVGGQLHVAVKRALERHPLPRMEEIVIIRVWRLRTVPPRQRR